MIPYTLAVLAGAAALAGLWELYREIRHAIAVKQFETTLTREAIIARATEDYRRVSQ